MELTQLAERETLKLTTLEYRVEDTGNFLSEPIVELFARDEDGNRRIIEVEGFHPFFYITESEYQQRERDIFTDSRVRRVVAREGVTSRDNVNNRSLTEVTAPPKETLLDDPLVKIETVVPSHVADLREDFDETWEADIFFTNRFLVSSGIHLGFTIPAGKDRVSYDEIEPTDDVPDVKPRIVTIDIEVWSGGEFPDTQNPTKPITAVTAHDSYTDEYVAAALHPSSTDEGEDNSWPMLPLDDTTHVFHDEAVMLSFINRWIVDKDPDLLTGWNSSRNDIGSGFDYPYWLNRCERINEWTYRDLPHENGSAFVTDRGAPQIGGREMFDMLQAYKKTQIHEKRSYSLDYIAKDELGYGKEDVADLDEGWLHEPREFMEYNIRDVEAVVEIEAAKSVIEMYDHIRSIAGATYTEIADSNIGIIDILYLREAKKRGIALPTSTRPDVQYYWGAYVFDPQSGKHENVVYPDLSSLYPNLFKDMNASPETIVGFEDDLAASQYTKDDCHVVYVDTRGMPVDGQEVDESIKRSADEPERTPLYVLKPSVKESFVRDVIGDLIDMKYEYKSDEYAPEAYAAVKRIVNSVYGCMGDSVSYGVGFRLFDWRIAEAITLAGRDVIKHTANEFESRVQGMGYSDAEIIAGDTDSCVCTIPGADGTYTNSSFDADEAVSRVQENTELDTTEEPVDSAIHETLLAAIDAAEYVDMTYDEYMTDRFNIEDDNMAVEIESYAKSALFMEKKKRYAQWVRWDEGDYVDDVEVKGFELVRSDSAEITERMQMNVLETILKETNPRPETERLIKESWDNITGGDVSLSQIGKPSAINSDIWTYGYTERDDGYDSYTPQPHIRGARYANEFIEGENIESGKPLMFYCTGVDGSSAYPESYDYPNRLAVDGVEMVERNREVDAVAIEDVSNMPRAVNVDWSKMAEKTLRDPIEPIVQVMGWSFSDLITDGQQTGLSSYM